MGVTLSSLGNARGNWYPRAKLKYRIPPGKSMVPEAEKVMGANSANVITVLHNKEHQINVERENVSL